MSKELDALKIIGELYLVNDEQVKDWDKRDFNILKSALQRLESIDNANPSKALEELIDMIEYFTRLDYVEPIVRNEIHDKFKDIYWHKLPRLDTIKQALLKAKFLEEEYNNLMEDKDNLESELFKLTAPKNCLKWEDLEFKIENQEMVVLLNGSYYLLEYYNDSEEDFVFIKARHTTVFELLGERSDDKQFFNDLRLERVE